MKSAIVPNLREWNECRADRLWGGTDCCRMFAETKGEGKATTTQTTKPRPTTRMIFGQVDRFFCFCFVFEDATSIDAKTRECGRTCRELLSGDGCFSSTFCLLDARVSEIFFGVFLLVLVIITWLFSMLLLVLPPRLDADVATVAVAAALPPLKAPKVFFLSAIYSSWRKTKRTIEILFLNFVNLKGKTASSISASSCSLIVIIVVNLSVEDQPDLGDVLRLDGCRPNFFLFLPVRS